MKLPGTSQPAAAGRIYERFEPAPPPIERSTWKRAWCGIIEVAATHAEPEALVAHLRTPAGDREATALVFRALVAAGVLTGDIERLARDSWGGVPEVVIVDAAMRTVRFRIEIEVVQDGGADPTRQELDAGVAAMNRQWAALAHAPLPVPLPIAQSQKTAPDGDRQLGLFATTPAATAEDDPLPW